MSSSPPRACISAIKLLNENASSGGNLASSCSLPNDDCHCHGNGSESGSLLVLFLCLWRGIFIVPARLPLSREEWSFPAPVPLSAGWEGLPERLAVLCLDDDGSGTRLEAPRLLLDGR